MNRSWQFALPSGVLALLLCASGAPSHAQVLYGSIIGTVEDPSGAVVPKAMITIANKQTGMTRDALSDEAGRYSILNVLPGLYELKVTAPGFRQMARTHVEIAVNT